MLRNILIIAIFVLYKFALPTSVSRPDDGPQFTGVYAVNNELQKAKRMFEGELFGPESFALDKDGTACINALRSVVMF